MDRREINKKFDVTEKQLDREAEEYEKGTWNEDVLGKVVMGRPSIANEEVRPITFRLPISKIAAIDKKAAKKGTSRSEFLREAIEKALS